MDFVGSAIAMTMHLCDQVRDTRVAREGFFALAKATFGIDFRPWYEAGWWGDAFQPHTLMDGDQAVANVSISWQTFDTPKGPARCAQLGGVMTRKDLRGQGFGRAAMEAALAACMDKADWVFLLANDSVLDYYPKFGFHKTRQRQYYVDVNPTRPDDRLLPVDAGELAGLAAQMDRAVPVSTICLRDRTPLAMFYLTGPLRKCVYRVDDALTVVTREDGETLLWDVFSPVPVELTQIARAVATPDAPRVALGFPPLDTTGFAARPAWQEDTTLFFRPANPAWLEDAMIPQLTHT